ncbi:peroxiredoxin [Streptomyces sp. CA-294286]|uniref:peroxiredoxin n=1 Tax=Streptomyces sp. CA-294286 TaxID=3240070 RepID=UPI003D924DFF
MAASSPQVNEAGRPPINSTPTERTATDITASARLLRGRALPALRLRRHDGGFADPVAAPTPYTVLYLYPGAYARRAAYPAGWAGIPGATGCTRQSCAYRDRLADFRAAGATVHGVSTQPPHEQAEFATKQRLRFPLLSDAELALATALGLPTFRVAGTPRLHRLTLVVDRDRTIREVVSGDTDLAASVDRALAAVLAAPRRG